VTGRHLGAELGGTWLRLCLADGSGRVLRRGRFRGGPWPGAPKMLASALRSWGRPRLETLTLGGKGLWGAREQKALARSLAPLARRVRVLSDLELTHRAAFSGGAGVLLIAGTGSAALGRDARGRLRRVGGWGPLLGDEGSAFWIGKEALKDRRLSKLWPADMPLKVGRGPDPIRATAALARLVLARAARGDGAARALRERAAHELAALAREAARGLPKPAALALRGGLFEDAALRARALELLPGLRLREEGLEPATAAARGL
jgi:predicted NBD/HSP70 family sugar kinase